ncbi:MAG: M61 family metallopeptidase, partial [Rhabdochlamydiaceae bacterium]
MPKYHVSMENPSSHYFEVVIEVSSNRANELASGKIRFAMPVWTPGSYLIREFSRNVLEFSATDLETDEELKSCKVSKNVWQVETTGSNLVRAKYLVYAFEPTVDTSYLDHRRAVINGASVFMYVEGFEQEESSLTILPYVDWKMISTGLVLKSTDEKSNAETFVVPNYDTLVDSPIEIGNQTIHFFRVSGKEHKVSISSQIKFDEASFVSDLKKIVETTITIFSDIPYERYLFLIDFVSEGYGGLEHLNSTYCIAPIFRLQPEQEYRQLLSLFSHEFFHAWNVKRMHPRGLGPFEYSKETYTKSLWIAEGLTSYYDDLIIRRAGLYSVGDYLDAFCSNISIMKSLPAGRWQSAEEASFDTWIKHYRQDENSPNTLSSYYLQGTLIGWMLDMEIRRSNNCSKTLDDAIRELYHETYLKEHRGYTDEEFERICEEHIG